MAEPVLARWRRYILRPCEIVRGFRLAYVRADLLAGLTVAVVAVPQSIAYASIAGLPPAAGLYAAGVASIAGALWGSSRFLSTGPTNAASILVLSALAPIAVIGSPAYVAAAATLAVLVGVFRIAFGLAGLGLLVNFASRAVLLGFTAGAGVLIAAGQLAPLLRLELGSSARLHQILAGLTAVLPAAHLPSLLVGIGTIAGTLLASRLCRRCPGALVAMVAAGLGVFLLGAERIGVHTVGAIAASLPSLSLPRLSLLVSGDTANAMLLGALAIAALGLVEAMSIARSIARSSGERIDADQEFVGQGMANLAAGLLSGYTCSGSFTRSAVNHASGARSPLASVFAGAVVLATVLAFGPLTAHLPRASLAGMLMLVAWSMVDRAGIRRIVRTSRPEAVILIATFVATLVLPLEFAVISGVLLSLAIYVYQSSMPHVQRVVPDETFRHFVERPGAPDCPQLAVINIRGALFFGAAAHVEQSLLENLHANPGQHLLLLRMHGVQQCDLSGIEALETVVRAYRRRDGDVFMVQVRPPVRELMRQSGFEEVLGDDHFLKQEEAIDLLFADVLDPAVCIYECEERVFAECQALPKHAYDARLPSATPARPGRPGAHLGVQDLEALLGREREAVVLDVREPDEFRAGHLGGARLVPLRCILQEAIALPKDRPIVLLCRSGRRSTRAMHMLEDLGFDALFNLRGGILSWKASGRPLVVE